MLFQKLTPGIEVTFHSTLEVETVRASYEEYASRLLFSGGGEELSVHDQDVIQRWEGSSRSLRGSTHLAQSAIDRLYDFSEATGGRIDELLDEHDNPGRLADAAKRHELGAYAFGLADSIADQLAMHA